MAISPSGNTTNALAGDIGSISRLRNSASADPRAAIKEASKQFESIFMQQLLKGMRDANETMSPGMFDNAGTKMGTEMLDQQYAKEMTGRPGGLAELIERQLQRQLGDPVANIASEAAANPAKPDPAPRSFIGRMFSREAAPSSTPAAAAPAAAERPISLQGRERQVEFLKRHEDAAKAAEASSGIPATFMMAQAAHESGWGRREIRNGDGSSSHNVFGIKAGPGWKGAVTEITTTEVIGGQARKVTAKFRAYASYEESFKDYARMMKNNPRYAQVVENADSAQGFARGLQRAGYATDPQYADKLTRMINTTLRLQRATA
ncbi:flagellar assembly peptidoglycan hydrolase FlgJ [Rhizobacter sp. LjRoot28]|jgi:peptidoglycan hydrolase FlgJ|uniref:flagellar assembly peptidoglycan hydrolase FlgJ n=1 Tax=Rhizobacter sp. LjRoot28 TaxID=3342309 RepID=UPI003ECF21F4